MTHCRMLCFDVASAVAKWLLARHVDRALQLIRAHNPTSSKSNLSASTRVHLQCRLFVDHNHDHLSSESSVR
jgi:hypothetical protein